MCPCSGVRRVDGLVPSAKKPKKIQVAPRRKRVSNCETSSSRWKEFQFLERKLLQEHVTRGTQKKARTDARGPCLLVGPKHEKKPNSNLAAFGCGMVCGIL
jgi:hypothetical protein